MLPFVFAMFLLIFLSGLLGWGQGRSVRNRSEREQLSEYLLDQYILAQEDFTSGRLDLARQRFEHIFALDPVFLDVADRWLDVMVILSGTATPTPAGIEVSPTPTIDPRPAQELFTLAQSLIALQDWNQAIEVLSSLRTENSSYNFVEVDRMLYLALRNRGMYKISVDGNLEGGLYDFALAEGFGPIDAAAANLRELARLYLIGNSFWVAYPDVAAYYYGQVASVAPNLRDSSGLSAFYRYWASLVQYGDQLALEEDWCAAAEQYQFALIARSDQNIVPTSQYVTELCYLMTATATATGTGTATITSTPTFGPSFTPTPTGTFGATPTSSSTPAATPTDTVGAPTPTPTPSPTSTPLPTATATATP
jgi:tetratricopeptide (TPR) repeat protein